jgi:2-C-methyl-D-erythritol 4-phosphate cytidylyltransferase/2-C-methyl-D-erythritol 2,4-cyclodiphosphate synthase
MILAETVRLAAERRSLVCVNVDVNVILERPKLGRRKEAMRARLAGILGLPVERVSIKARTAEGLGAVGRCEAVEVHAAVLMEARSTP